MKEVTLTTWANLKFEKPPSRSTLRAWARTGQITPRPKKVGRWLMVREDAEYTPLDIETNELPERVRQILGKTAQV